MEKLKTLTNAIGAFIVAFIHVILFLIGMTIIVTATFLLTTVGGLYIAGAFLILIGFMLTDSNSKK